MKSFIVRVLHWLGICFPHVLITDTRIYVTCQICGTTDIIKTGGDDGYMEKKAARAPGVY